MDWVNKLNKAIGYIEKHLKDEIDYNELCRICECSLPKFQQMFSVTCEIPVSEYIRNRRMTVAAYDLVNTNIKIIDLAFILGYESPESFTRGYQLFHGVPPTATRKTKKYKEYFRASIQMQVYGGKFKMGTKAVMRIETERTVIRKFESDDWKDLQEIAVTKENSTFAATDHPWPLDEEGIRDICAFFVKGHQYWAVEVKELKKVICFINFNSMDDQQSLDIGHVINTEYLHLGYEYEVLKALYNYGFLQLGAERIQAAWALHDMDKLESLYKLGMKVVETYTCKNFRPDPDGKVGTFEGCKLLVTREEWITNPAV